MQDNAIIVSIDSIRSRASTQETLITLAVPVEHASKIAKFLSMIGQQVGVAFAEIGAAMPVADIVEDVKPVEDYGHYIAALYKCGFWFNPKVLRALNVPMEVRLEDYNEIQAYTHAALSRIFGVNHLSDVSPAKIREWAESHGLLSALPAVFKE